MTSNRQAASVDAILRALADQHRRLVLRQVRNASDEVFSYEDVANRIVQHSSAVEKPEAVMVDLHHQILPKLDEVDLVEYDSRSETIRYQPQELAEDILDCIDERPRWAK